MKTGEMIVRSPALRLVLPCTVGILALAIALRLLPLVDARSDLRGRLDAVALRREMLETLYPVYLEIRALQGIKDWPERAVPARRALDEEALLAAPDMLGRLAANHAFEPDPVLVEVASENGCRRLHVTLSMRGSHLQLGPLLAEIIRLPSFVSLDRVSVLRDEDQDVIRLEFMLDLEPGKRHDHA